MTGTKLKSCKMKRFLLPSEMTVEGMIYVILFDIF